MICGDFVHVIYISLRISHMIYRDDSPQLGAIAESPCYNGVRQLLFCGSLLCHVNSDELFG